MKDRGIYLIITKETYKNLVTYYDIGFCIRVLFFEIPSLNIANKILYRRQFKIATNSHKRIQGLD